MKRQAPAPEQDHPATPVLPASLFIRKYGTQLILLLFITALVSCKKNKMDAPPNNNEINATVVVSPVSTITINATGTDAKLGCSLWGGGTYLNAVATGIGAVYIDALYSSGTSCISAPGTYNLRCEYRANGVIYGSLGVTPGSITFTLINDHYMEGNFNAVCKCVSVGCVFGVDSVLVTGTFKGDRFFY